MRRLAAWDRYPRLMLVFTTLLFSLPWFFFGLQLQDMGWQLTKSWMMMEHPTEAYWDAAWLSSMLPGLWMKTGEYSLFWMRLAYIPVYATILLLLYRLLIPIYRPDEVLFPLVLTFLLASAGQNTFVVDYYLVPPLFGLGAILAFYLAAQASGSKRRFIYNCLSGVLFALLVQSRVPSLLLGVLYPVIIAVYHLRGDNPSGSDKYRWSDLLPVVSGFILGTGGIALALAGSGNLELAWIGILESLREGSTNAGADNIHNPFRLIQDTSIRYLKAFGVGAVILSGVWIFSRVLPAKLRDKSLWLAYCIGLPVAGGTAYLAIAELGMFPPSIGIIVILSAYFLWREWQRGWSGRLFLAVSGVIYLVTMNAGSSNPQVGSLKFTIYLIAPVVMVELFRRAENREVIARVVSLILSVNIVVLFLSTRMFYGVSILESTGALESERIEGILWTPPYVESVENAMRMFRENGMKEGDTVLFYVDVPIYHFLTGTIPALRNPWISSYAVGFPSTERSLEMINRMKREGGLPEFIVRVSDEISTGEIRSGRIRMLDSVWAAEDYDTIARTGQYSLMKRPDN